jgi:hypothetical protein
VTGAFPAVLVVALAATSAGSCGRRETRFEHTFDSPLALATAVLAAAEARDRAALERLALSESEFRDEVYPEMPAWGRIPLAYVWGDLRQKSQNQVARLLATLGGQSLVVEDVVFDGGATAYRTFVVHRKPRLVIRERSTGAKREMAVFGSVIEYGGRYRLFSYVVNR